MKFKRTKLTLMGCVLFVTIPFILAKYKNTYISICDNVIEGRVGTLNKNTMHTRISDQVSISVRQGILGRVFNYGDVVINTPSGQYNYRKIHNPYVLRNIIISKQTD